MEAFLKKQAEIEGSGAVGATATATVEQVGADRQIEAQVVHDEVVRRAEHPLAPHVGFQFRLDLAGLEVGLADGNLEHAVRLARDRGSGKQRESVVHRIFALIGEHAHQGVDVDVAGGRIDRDGRTLSHFRLTQIGHFVISWPAPLWRNRAIQTAWRLRGPLCLTGRF